MIGRNKRGSRQAGLKVRLGVAAAVLAGGSAVGVAAVAASHHSTTTTATNAGFALSFHHNVSEQAALSAALTTWANSPGAAMNTLARMTPMRNFTQFNTRFAHHRTMLAAQRGVVVLATPKFIVVKSANGGLHLWWINGATMFTNVTASVTGMVALTGNNMAAFHAMATNNMAPAATVMAGSTLAVNQMTAPVAKPVTLTIQTGTETITITITSSTATVTQPVTAPTPVVTPTATVGATVGATATATAGATVTPVATPTATVTGTPVATPVPTATTTMPVTTVAQGIARGDLVFVTGVRVHGFLIAKLVLFAATQTGMPVVTPTATPTITGTPTVKPTPTGTTSTFTGVGS